ncbi:NADPH-dependent F420 reductase [Phenylobacterium deserti]|uniref:NADP oxidoreductase n=1 Tax=Phenylobacterium deserti TaxID=1914756 RepID=A0A328AD61_9CAUL|nr:NAD(P)-binding domain-containing protein [Phenylobacterium deserti]RAK52702.1 NADP oxidoreductase [Phenylobacterium deserti]
MTTLGIIGAGGVGAAIGRSLARSGLPFLIANRRGPDSLRTLADELGLATPATVAEAAQADLVFVAVNWSKLPAALAGLGPWNGRIVVDANNPLEAPLFKPVDLGGRASTQVFADLVPGARVVKGFNTLPPELLGADPQEGGGRRVLFLSGDDAGAKAEVAALVDRLGFAGIDLGGLETGGRLGQFPGGPLPGLNLVRL